MAHLFISHSTRDGGGLAQQLTAALEAAGHRCWIAPRDVKPGVPYPGQIVTAIEGCGGLVLLVTPSANDSPDVLQEVQLASTARKTIAPVIVGGCAPGPDLRYYLGVRHQIPWSDAHAVSRRLLASVGSAEKSPASADPQVSVAAISAKSQVYEVTLERAGDKPKRVARVIWQFTGLDDVTALKRANTSGSTLRRTNDLQLAEDFAAKLRAAGATVTIHHNKGNR